MPRFAAKLVLTPIQIPHREQAFQDVFLVNPADNESEVSELGLVFPAEAISLRQKKATRVSLPEQEEIDTGQLIYLDVPDPDDDEKTMSVPHFVSGVDLATLVRRERAKLLHAFSTQSDAASRQQEAGDWEGAQQAYVRVIDLAEKHKPPSKPAFEAESIHLPLASSASVHYQLAKVMWMVHNYHWQMMSAMECAVKKDDKNPKYKAFQQLFRYPFNEDMHAQARPDPDFFKAIGAFAQNRPAAALANVNKALERLPEDQVFNAFKHYLQTHEIEPEFDFG